MRWLFLLAEIQIIYLTDPYPQFGMLVKFFLGSTFNEYRTSLTKNKLYNSIIN